MKDFHISAFFWGDSFGGIFERFRLQIGVYHGAKRSRLPRRSPSERPSRFLSSLIGSLQCFLPHVSTTAGSSTELMGIHCVGLRGVLGQEKPSERW